MKKSDLAAGTMYAYASGNRTPEPALLLDLRLWKLRGGRTSDPDAWKDVTGEHGARPGRSSGYTSSTMTGYLVLKGNNWLKPPTAEDLAAVAVPPLPEDSRAAVVVLATLNIPDGIHLDLVVTGSLRAPWEGYLREKEARDAEEAELRRAREKTISEHEAAWRAASDRLGALSVEAIRLKTAKDVTAEPAVRLTLTELNKLLDLAEGGTP
ncbi:hypothetical protein [Streptomyces sp. NPDC018055]|uniref:hypothetical protein n=1 Tax=Streptomyces sp. NPDC018055 TaxID=3365038 RepID=UPI00379C8F99